MGLAAGIGKLHRRFRSERDAQQIARLLVAQETFDGGRRAPDGDRLERGRNGLAAEPRHLRAGLDARARGGSARRHVGDEDAAIVQLADGESVSACDGGLEQRDLDVAAAEVDVTVAEGQRESAQGEEIFLRVALRFGLLDARTDVCVQRVPIRWFARHAVEGILPAGDLEHVIEGCGVRERGEIVFRGDLRRLDCGWDRIRHGNFGGRFESCGRIVRRAGSQQEADRPEHAEAGENFFHEESPDRRHYNRHKTRIENGKVGSLGFAVMGQHFWRPAVMRDNISLYIWVATTLIPN